MISVVLLLAGCMGQADAVKPVTKEVAKATTLFASSESHAACVKAFIAQQQKMLAHPEWLKLSEDRRRQLGLGTPQECIDAEVARLTIGVTVDVSSNPGVCAPLEGAPVDTWVRVRVTSGKNAGAIGCVSPKDLRDAVPF